MKLPQPFNASTAGCRISCAEAPIMMRKSPGSITFCRLISNLDSATAPVLILHFVVQIQNLFGANSKSESKPTQTILPKLLKGMDY